MLQEIIDEYLLQREKEKEGREHSGLWNPSNFGRCFRQQFLKRKGVPFSNPPDLFTLRKFARGNLVHDALEKLVTCVRPNCQVESVISTDDVSGRVDLLFPDCVIDIKSKAQNQMFYARKCLPKDFTPANFINNQTFANRYPCELLQTMFYAIHYSRPKAILALVEENLSVLEFIYDVTDEWRHSVNNELTTLRSYWLLDEMPPPKSRTPYAECSYCVYRDYCKDLENKHNEDEHSK